MNRAMTPNKCLPLTALAVLLSSLVSPESLAQDQTPEKRWLYVARAAKDRNGFRELAPSLEVHDIDDNHKLVKVIPLPKNVYAVRGIAASAQTGKLYISHYGQFAGRSKEYGNSAAGGGRLLCFDLVTNKAVWDKAYPPSADRFAITPDGKRIYFPAGEERDEKSWTIIDAATGNVVAAVSHAARPHNTITSLDGRLAYLQAFGNPEQPLNEPGTRKPLPDRNPHDGLTHDNGFLTDEERSLVIVDTRTNEIVRRVGPFRERTRPFTIDGRGAHAFVTVNDLIGFQVGDLRTGKVLHTAMPPATFAQPASTMNGTWSHGIALTPDEREVWVVDQKHIGIHVFDIGGLPQRAPVWSQFIKTRSGSPEIFGQPGWIMATIDGRFLYPETGEIVDTRRKKIVGQLVGADGKATHSRFAIEIDFRGDAPVRVGDQFGVGRVR